MSTQETTPEFHVLCVMCGTTFSATADTLKELVEIVGLHLKLEPHKKYIDNNPSEATHVANLRIHHNNAEEILNSPKFVWSIDRLSPFTDKIREVSKVKPFPSIPTITA